MIIGSIGFVVNFLFLSLLYHFLKFPIIASEFISAELAVLSTFVGNNYWVFSGHKHLSFARKVFKFHISAIGGLIINTVAVSIIVDYAHLYYGFALVIGSLLALIWNYTLYKKFVFEGNKEEVINEVEIPS